MFSSICKIFKNCQKEQVDWKYSVSQVFLKISQNWQENACDGVYFLIKLQAYTEHLKLLFLIMSWFFGFNNNSPG